MLLLERSRKTYWMKLHRLTNIDSRPSMSIPTMPSLPPSRPSLRTPMPIPPINPPTNKLRERKFSPNLARLNLKDNGDERASSVLRDELAMLLEENENILEKLRIAEDNNEEAVARVRELKIQVFLLSFCLHDKQAKVVPWLLAGNSPAFIPIIFVELLFQYFGSHHYSPGIQLLSCAQSLGVFLFISCVFLCVTTLIIIYYFSYAPSCHSPKMLLICPCKMISML